MSLGARKPTGNNRNMLLAAIGLAATILILAAILAAGMALYLLTTGHSTSTTTLTTTTARTTTSRATTTIPGTGISPRLENLDVPLQGASLQSSTTTTQRRPVTTTLPETLPSEPTTSEAATSTTEESSTTTLPDMTELAACLNGKGVKLFVNDACLKLRCEGIQKYFGQAFDLLNVINCNLEANEEECDNARNDVDTFGFPLWYVGSRGDYYSGATVGYIRSETGC